MECCRLLETTTSRLCSGGTT